MAAIAAAIDAYLLAEDEMPLVLPGRGGDGPTTWGLSGRREIMDARVLAQIRLIPGGLRPEK